MSESFEDTTSERTASVPVISGFRTLLAGFTMLARERSLWGLASIPLSLSLVLLVGATLGLIEFADPVYAMLTSAFPTVEVGAWYSWLWLGPLKLFLLILGGLFFAFFAGFVLLVSLLLANLLSAPFLDALSRRTERLVSGGIFEGDETGWSEIWSEARRTLANESQRVLFFLAIWLVISVGGVLIPGGQLVAPPLLLTFTALFLPLDYAGYAFDRRQISFRRRRIWIRENLATMAGFGVGALGISLVPGLNLLLLPSLVVGGTLLSLRFPPAD